MTMIERIYKINDSGYNLLIRAGVRAGYKVAVVKAIRTILDCGLTEGVQIYNELVIFYERN